MRRLNTLTAIALVWLPIQPIVPASAQSPSIALSQYKHTRWTVDNGVPNPILSLAQSSDGYIWIGTRDGVFRFDGVQFEEVPPNVGSVAKSGAQKLLTARDGSVWAGYREGGLAVYRRGAFRDMGLKRWPSPDGFLMAMAQSVDGAIWAASYLRDNPLAQYQNGKWRKFGEAEGVPDHPISLMAAKDGSLWLTSENAVLVRRPGDATFQRTAIPLKGYAALSEDAAGRIWVSDLLGSRVVEPSPNAHSSRRFNYPAPDFVRARQTIFDQKGNLWMADGLSGVWMTQLPEAAGARAAMEAAARVERFGVNEGLTSDNVTALLVDHEGSIWVGSLLGLDQFRRGSVIVEPALTKLPRWGYSVFSASDGTVYISQDNSIYRARPGHRPEPFLRPASVNQAICESPDGSIWFAFDAYMARFNNGNWSRTAFPEGLKGTVHSCAVDKNSKLWIAAERYGTFVRDGFTWKKVINKHPEDRSRPMLSTRDGGIIGYTENGLAICNEYTGCKQIEAAKPSIIGDTQTLLKARGYLLAGGAKGLARISGNHADLISADRFPMLRGIVGIVQTPEDETWLMVDAGIIRLSTSALERAFIDPAAKLEPLLLTTRDGLPGIAIRSGLRDAVRGGDGRLWFITSAGVVWVDPAHLARNPLPPKIAIRSLTAGGKIYRDADKVTLPAGTTSGQIDFAVLSLTIPQRNQVRYRLEGSDEGWVDPGMRRQMFFSNLAPGIYKLHVLASNNDRIWNRQGASVEFKIPPTFIQSVEFKLLCGLAMMAVLWLAYTIRLRQITAAMHARLEDRLEERARIARDLHDTLLQGFQGLILRFQAAANEIPEGLRARTLMENSLDSADVVLSAGRENVKHLRATETKDLATAFAETVDTLQRDHPVEFKMVIEGIPRELHPVVYEELYRIGNEALINAFRHARAVLIELAVSYQQSSLTIGVRDNGIGIEAEFIERGGRQGHFGLVGMRERARQIQSDLVVSSQESGGTQVQITVPGRIAYLAYHRDAGWWQRLRGRAGLRWSTDKGNV